MKVAFNSRILCDPSLRGWNRYAANLISELASLGVQLFLYSDRPLHESHLLRLPQGSYRMRVSAPITYPLWEQYWLPSQCAADGVDVLHTPFHFGVPLLSPCPRVLTIHDAIREVYYSRFASFMDRFKIQSLKSGLYHWLARRGADRIITVSEHSKTDLVAHLGIPPERISVIYEGADPNFHREIREEERRRVRDRFGLGRPYILYVGGWEGRKNIPFLLKAFSEARLEEVDLVLIGGAEEDKLRVDRLVRTTGLSGRVRLFGRLEDILLPPLYAEALGFVYPSMYEGFGLQLCEAMAVGCPILAANASSLPEILGDGGETFALTAPDSLSVLLRRLAHDGEYRRDLSARARKRGRHFSWRKAAEQTLALYRQCE